MTSVTVNSPDQQIQDPDVIGRRWRTGVLLYIVADVAFVFSLVFTYFYLRGLNTSGAWVAPGQKTSAIWFNWMLAAVLAVSALIYNLGERAIQAGKRATFVSAAGVALLVLIAAVVLQVIQLMSFPFGIGTSAYSSTVYVLAGAELFHLLITAFLGLAMFNRGRARIYSGQSNWQVRLVGMWWTWIAIAAVITALTTSFVASPNHGH